MSIESASNQWVCDLVAYEPGKPIEETARELGLKPEEIIKLASNENPLGPSPMAQEAMRAEIEKAHLYPDGGGYKLRTALAEKHGVAFENVILGNGSNEIIELLCHSFLKPGVALIAAEHAFVVYKLMATLFGADYKEVPDPGFVHDLEGMADAITPETRLVFIANPNNPTGTLVGQEEIDRFIERLPDHVVAVFDEAYFEFLPDAPDAIKHVKAGKNVVVMRTFSKAQGLSALRIGYGLAPAPIAGLLNRARQPFNANAIAQAAALASMQDEEHIAATVENNRIGLEFFQSAFAERGWEFVPSVANFVLVNVGDGDRVFGELLKKGVIVRAMRGYKLPEWVRISVGTPSQNERCLAELDVILAS
ncbi:histidinol-phosphate transaminase [bacterium]|nr:histidinol-phosphate transaminase [Akkermansiaceae bacterium]MDB4273398.1 histidinol-phosphate transaminase [Akkermansiaceae bacterium]MDB4588284.1 histidinol-phosphate transaminase [bacterium]